MLFCESENCLEKLICPDLESVCKATDESIVLENIVTDLDNSGENHAQVLWRYRNIDNEMDTG